MRNAFVSVFLLFLVPLAAGQTTAPATRPSAAALPSMQDISDTVDAGKYREALAQIAKVIDLHGKAGAAYDHHQLLMLRAECMMQQKETQSALTFLAAAQKDVAKPEEAYEPQVLTLLIQRAKNWKYTPKSNSTGYNLLDRAARKNAYKALWDEEEPALAMDKVPGNIPAILEQARHAANVRAIEYAATESTTKSQEFITKLGDKAKTLLTDNLKEMRTKVETISREASRRVQRVVGNTIYEGPAGLSPEQGRELQNIENTCNQYAPALTELAKLFPDQAKTYTEIASNAATLKQQAATVRTTRYN